MKALIADLAATLKGVNETRGGATHSDLTHIRIESSHFLSKGCEGRSVDFGLLVRLNRHAVADVTRYLVVHDDDSRFRFHKRYRERLEGCLSLDLSDCDLLLRRHHAVVTGSGPDGSVSVGLGDALAGEFMKAWFSREATSEADADPDELRFVRRGASTWYLGLPDRPLAA